MLDRWRFEIFHTINHIVRLVLCLRFFSRLRLQPESFQASARRSSTSVSTLQPNYRSFNPPTDCLFKLFLRYIPSFIISQVCSPRRYLLVIFRPTVNAVRLDDVVYLTHNMQTVQPGDGDICVVAFTGPSANPTPTSNDVNDKARAQDADGAESCRGSTRLRLVDLPVQAVYRSGSIVVGIFSVVFACFLLVPIVFFRLGEFLIFLMLRRKAMHTYSPLVQQQLSDEIRVVEIQPGQHSDPICCTLVHGTRSSLEYEALSYSWESGYLAEVVNVDGRSFTVTKSLYRALLHLRHPTAPRRMWIDQISINQYNDGEKSQQVSDMKQTFEMASRVVVWLGEGAKPGDDVCILLGASVPFILRRRDHSGILHQDPYCKHRRHINCCIPEHHKIVGQAYLYDIMEYQGNIEQDIEHGKSCFEGVFH